MSVIVTLRIAGNPEAIEQYAKDNAETFQGIVEAAKRHGLIAHRFYGSQDGNGILVIDEWPDSQSFDAFFQEQQPQIGPMMQAVGVTAAPEASYWHELATDDAYGWNA